MNAEFVRNRITELRLKMNVSEREVSFALNKTSNYINNITSGKSLPLMENFFDICDFFGITPFEFFYPAIDDPIASKKIYDQMKRLSNNDLSEFLLFLEIMNPTDYSAIVSFMNRYQLHKKHMS